MLGVGQKIFATIFLGILSSGFALAAPKKSAERKPSNESDFVRSAGVICGEGNNNLEAISDLNKKLSPVPFAADGAPNPNKVPDGIVTAQGYFIPGPSFIISAPTFANGHSGAMVCVSVSKK